MARRKRRSKSRARRKGPSRRASKGAGLKRLKRKFPATWRRISAGFGSARSKIGERGARKIETKELRAGLPAASRGKIERVSTGSRELDRMLKGGIPRGHSVLAIGPPGSGKTTLCLQFLHEGLRRGERCLLLSLEENKSAALRTAENYGWDFKRYMREERLGILIMDPRDIEGTTKVLHDKFPKIVRWWGFDRVVVDPLSIFELIFIDPAEKRQRVFELTDLIKRSGATSMYTAEVNPDNPIFTRSGLIEYACDAFISLRYMVTPEGELRFSIQPIKIRRSDHSKNMVEFKITDRGIRVYPNRRLDTEGHLRGRT